MQQDFASLPWLPAAPADFMARCRELTSADTGIGAKLQHLAGHRLNPAQSASLGRALKRAREAGKDLTPLSGFRLGVVAGGTVDLLVDCLPAAAARHGVSLQIDLAPYDQVMQQALDPQSAINRARLDAVLVAVDHRWLKLDRPSLAGGAADVVGSALETMRSVVTALREFGGAPAILQTLPTPPNALFGALDRRVAGTVRAMVEKVNQGLVGLADELGCYLLDTAALAERIGTDRWFDPVQYYAYKLPFAADCILAQAEMVGRFLGSVRGKARKCLVLDLDNTVWGGVIGDDGMDGIKIGQGSAVGEAHLAVQRLALDLRERGIILAVSSKNTDAVAREPFRNHPDMLLRENHIAVFQANWLDKPSNLEAIARTLNIGIDALVFLDDNGAERAHVRAALPMVGIPELPEDASLYPWFLSAAGYFESVAFSGEDRLRAESYSSDAQRAVVQQQSRDLGDYLSSLGMTISFAPFDDTGRQRIAQLIGKSNQFNLTTRRYTEAEVAAMQADPSLFTLQVRLEDRFGDLGMISVVVGRETMVEGERALDLDTWLMSCRVLGRKVEEAMLRHIVREANRRGIRLITSSYKPSPKNSMVSEHYDKLGFEHLSTDETGRKSYQFRVDNYTAPELPFEVKIVDAVALAVA